MEISRPEHASSYPTEVYQRQYPQFLHHNSLQASQHNLIIIYYKLAQSIKEIVPLQSRLIALRLLNILNIFITPSNILRRIHISRRDSSNSLGETRENAGSCYRTNAGAGDVETNGRVTAGSQVVAPVDAEGHIATLKHNEAELSSLGMVVVFDLTMPP
ncbi:hypothetical protein F8388_024051 [Cannabis sativa]|uniref:Uncharacterized protein n=1 Tax=Cannabis sativa TaxID=3483 RepID=A0A7J6FXP4_CANSA|nr:hypothetical protein G4B88_021964 [Cannabis sativa]KAF4375392.1 hypothetical protein F8388_024051 [Cannabis sativa]